MNAHGHDAAVGRLVLIRHAKAVAHSFDDRSRDLSARGERDATLAGKWLGEQDVVPDHVVVSPSNRTRQTWDLIARAMPTAAQARFDERIYENTLEDALAVVQSAPASAKVVALVGHNPSMHLLAASFNSSSGRDVSRLREFPTCAIAVLDVEKPWAKLELGRGRLREFVVPRD